MRQSIQTNGGYGTQTVQGRERNAEAHEAVAQQFQSKTLTSRGRCGKTSGYIDGNYDLHHRRTGNLIQCVDNKIKAGHSGDYAAKAGSRSQSHQSGVGILNGSQGAILQMFQNVLGFKNKIGNSSGAGQRDNSRGLNHVEDYDEHDGRDQTLQQRDVVFLDILGIIPRA